MLFRSCPNPHSAHKQKELRAAPFAYVPNEGSGTISIIDTQTDEVVDEINIGGKPRGIAISPDGNTLYVSEQKGEHVDVIDTKNKKFIEVILDTSN